MAKKKIAKKDWTWAGQLALAVTRGRFLKIDKVRAQDWTRCAVGEAPAHITEVKLHLDGLADMDTILDEAGVAFGDAVEYDLVGEAVDQYHIIRKRVRELKAERKAA